MTTHPEGRLTVVSTPIGNLGDFSPRAIETLKNSDLILAEDTRSFGTLAQRFEIRTQVKSYFEHNERGRVAEVIALLESGKQIALVSEAGTPAVSDPGYRIVRACRERQIAVSGVPGASAALLALSISGLPSDRFLFQGFLPQRPGRRSAMLKNLLELDVTFILFESPHRIVKTLTEIQTISPTRELYVGRELTKFHEESLWGHAEDVLAKLAKKESIKGEIVLVVSRGSVEEEEAGEEPDDAPED